MTFDFEPGRPTVTINKRQPRCKPTRPMLRQINFTAVFSASVSGFDGNDIDFGSTPGSPVALVTEVGPMDGTTCGAPCSGMADGTVSVSVKDMAADTPPG